MKKKSSLRSSPHDERLFYAFLALIFWLPLPLGSNRPWAWHLMEVVVFSLCLWWIFLYTGKKVRYTEALKNAKSMFLCLGGFALVILLQLLPMPLEWVAKLRVVNDSLEAGSFRPISIDPFSTWIHLRMTFAFIGIAFLMLALIDSPSRLKKFAVIVLIVGVIQAVYGGLMTLSGAEYGFFIKKWTYVSHATGTFVNRNHLANYLILSLSVGTGLLLSDLYQRSSRNWKERQLRIIQAILGSKFKIRVGLALMVIALVLTKSRMGNTAFFLSLMAAGFLWILLTKRITKGSIILLVSLLVIDTIMVGAWFGIDKVRDRLEGTTFAKETRDEVNRDTWGLVKDQPLFGTGAGTYYTAYPQYKSGDVNLYYDHAHNDYLQFVAEHGFVGISFLVLFVILALKNAVIAMKRRKRLFYQAMGFAPLMSAMAMAMHSLVEFNLQIPANAILFICILCIGYIIRFAPSSESG